VVGIVVFDTSDELRGGHLTRRGPNGDARSDAGPQRPDSTTACRGVSVSTEQSCSASSEAKHHQRRGQQQAALRSASPGTPTRPPIRGVERRRLLTRQVASRCVRCCTLTFLAHSGVDSVVGIVRDHVDGVMGDNGLRTEAVSPHSSTQRQSPVVWWEIECDARCVQPASAG
jgi:hypothetical protein